MFGVGAQRFEPFGIGGLIAVEFAEFGFDRR